MCLVMICGKSPSEYGKRVEIYKKITERGGVEGLFAFLQDGIGFEIYSALTALEKMKLIPLEKAEDVDQISDHLMSELKKMLE